MRPIDAAVLREIAVASSTDPRSVARALRGEAVRGMAGMRIRRELDARGIAVPAPPPPSGSGSEVFGTVAIARGPR